MGHIAAYLPLSLTWLDYTICCWTVAASWCYAKSIRRVSLTAFVSNQNLKITLLVLLCVCDDASVFGPVASEDWEQLAGHRVKPSQDSWPVCCDLWEMLPVTSWSLPVLGLSRRLLREHSVLRLVFGRRKVSSVHLFIYLFLILLPFNLRKQRIPSLVCVLGIVYFSFWIQCNKIKYGKWCSSQLFIDFHDFKIMNWEVYVANIQNSFSKEVYLLRSWTDI